MLYILCYTENHGKSDFRDYQVYDSQIQLGKAKEELGLFRHARQYAVIDEKEIGAAVTLDGMVSLSYRISISKLAQNPSVLAKLQEVLSFLEEE